MILQRLFRVAYEMNFPSESSENQPESTQNQPETHAKPACNACKTSLKRTQNRPETHAKPAWAHAGQITRLTTVYVQAHRRIGERQRP